MYYYDSKSYPKYEDEGRVGAIVHFKDGSDEEHIGISDIRRYIDQSIPGFDKGQAERVRDIHVYIPFPWIEKRGVFVDTPGRGALYDQNDLAESVLDEVDIIMCPFTATNYLDKNEDEFLRKLPGTEKKKLMYVLTQIDKANTPNDLANAVKAIAEKAGDVSGKGQPVYKVAARMVLDAYRERKSETEVERIKQDCGMHELETALDEKLREGTKADRRIREVCMELEQMLREDIKGLGKEIADFDSKRAEEDLREREAEAARQQEKATFEKSTKELKRKWDEEVRQAIAKIENEEYKTEDLDPDQIKVGSSYKKGKRVFRDIKQGVERELDELRHRLRRIVKTSAAGLDFDIDEDIPIGRYHTKSSRGGATLFISILIMAIGIIVGSSLLIAEVDLISSAHGRLVGARIDVEQFLIMLPEDVPPEETGRKGGDPPPVAVSPPPDDPRPRLVYANHYFWSTVRACLASFKFRQGRVK